MAIEDAAVLAGILSHIDSLEQMPDLLELFLKLRHERASEVQARSHMNSYIWHLHDGREQQARDQGMSAEVAGTHFIRSANQWSDPVCQLWLYNYDAEKDAEQAVKEHFPRLAPTKDVSRSYPRWKEEALWFLKGVAHGKANHNGL